MVVSEDQPLVQEKNATSNLESLEEENARLRLILQRLPRKFADYAPPHEDLITEMELRKLREASEKRTLTMEETKQFEIYTKHKRASESSKPKDADNELRDVSERDLLEAAQGGTNTEETS